MNNEHFLLIGTLLLTSGIILIIAGISFSLRNHRKYSTWESTSGTVTNVITHSISSSDFHYYPIIEFKTKDGKTIIFESDLGFYPAKHKQGQQVSILYDKVAPDNAVLNLKSAKWAAPFTIGAFGVLAVVIGGIILSIT